MAREVINVGAAPNDGQGDPIRTAYIKTNNNFAELYSAVQLVPPSTLLGSPGNKAGMIAYSPTAFYYCFQDYDGSSEIWGELTISLSGSEILNGTSNVSVNASSNVTVSIAGVSNVAVFYASGLAVTGNVNVSANVTTGNVSGTTGAFTNVGGTLTTAAQTNITSVGTLTSLAVTGNATVGNISATNLGNISSINLTGNSSNVLYGNGVFAAVSGGGGTPGGLNTYVQFNDASTFGGNANFTYNKTTNTLTAGNISGTLTTAAQTNITSVGTLTSLAVTGNITSGNVSGTTGAFTNVGGTLTTAAQTNITSVGTLTSLGVTGNITTGNANASGNISASFFKGDGGYLTNVTAAGAAATSISNGTSSIAFTGSGGNAIITIGGTANVGVWATTGVYITGLGNATGNLNGANLTTPGVVTATGNLNGNNATITNAVVAATGTFTGNVTTGNIQGITHSGTTGTFSGNVTTGNVSGTTVSGTTGTFTGNVTTGNIQGITHSGTTGTFTGNVTTGNISGTTVSGTTGTFSGNVTTGNIQGNTHSGTTGTFTGNITAGNLSVGTGVVTLGGIVNANGNGIGNIGSASLYFNTVFAQATSAQYADLAEMYQGDRYYSPGTVLSFGGSNEVTIAEKDHDVMVAGIVSTRPAYTMNSTLTGPTAVAIALAGRVPCTVQGPVLRGQMLVTAGNGRARAELNPVIGTVIGKALQDFDGSVGVIEIVVGRL
jgi:hypothetical protein